VAAGVVEVVDLVFDDDDDDDNGEVSNNDGNEEAAETEEEENGEGLVMKTDELLRSCMDM